MLRGSRIYIHRSRERRVESGHEENTVKIRPKLTKRKVFIEAMERWYWHEVMKATGGSIVKASQLAGVNRTDTYKRFERLGIQHLLPSRQPDRKSGGHRGAWDRPIPGDLRESPPQVSRTTRSTPPPVSPINRLRAPTSTPAERRLARILAIRPELLAVGNNRTLLTPDGPRRRTPS